MIHQVDVKSTFLYGELDEDIYITLPKAMETDPGKPYKFRKSLHGLKQAPKAWFEKVTSEHRFQKRSDRGGSLHQKGRKTLLI